MTIRRSICKTALTALMTVSTFSCAIVTTASAATVQIISGDVLVNKGNGFKSIKDTSQVRAGDSVMARQSGSARISYGKDCQEVSITHS